MNTTSNWFQKKDPRTEPKEKVSIPERIEVGSLSAEPPILPGASLTAETGRQKVSALTGIDPLQISPELDKTNIFLVKGRGPTVNFPDSLRLRALIIITIAFSILIIIRTESSRVFLAVFIIISIIIVSASLYWVNNPNRSSIIASMYIILLLLYTFLANGLNVSTAFEIFTSLGIVLILIFLLYQTRFWPLLIPFFLILIWIWYLLVYPQD